MCKTECTKWVIKKYKTNNYKCEKRVIKMCKPSNWNVQNE